MDEWEIRVTNEILVWINLDGRSKAQVIDAIDRLAEGGPGLGRPLVDRLEGSQVHNLKELRPGSAGRSEVRIVFVFDPWRSAIPRAEELHREYLKEREAEEGQR